MAVESSPCCIFSSVFITFLTPPVESLNRRQWSVLPDHAEETLKGPETELPFGQLVNWEAAL